MVSAPVVLHFIAAHVNTRVAQPDLLVWPHARQSWAAFGPNSTSLGLYYSWPRRLRARRIHGECVAGRSRVRPRQRAEYGAASLTAFPRNCSLRLRSGQAERGGSKVLAWRTPAHGMTEPCLIGRQAVPLHRRERAKFPGSRPQLAQKFCARGTRSARFFQPPGIALATPHKQRGVACNTCAIGAESALACYSWG